MFTKPNRTCAKLGLTEVWTTWYIMVEENTVLVQNNTLEKGNWFNFKCKVLYVLFSILLATRLGQA